MTQPLPTNLPSPLVSLLAASKEAPDDPLPRQVLADWLAEHDYTDLAECVRLSWQAAQLHEYDGRRQLIRALVNDPRRTTGRWLAPLRRHLSVDFHGGLLRVLATPAKLLQLRPDDVLTGEYLPWLETLRLRSFGSGSELLRLSRAGWLRPFTALDLDQSGLLDQSFVTLLRDTPVHVPGHFAHLRQLSLRHGHLTATFVSELTAQPERVPLLRSLVLYNNNQIGPAGVRQLADAPLLSQLTSLDLYHVEMGAEGAAALGASPRAAGLRALDVGLNSFGAEGLRALIESPHLGQLRSLRLSGLGSDAGSDALRNWPAGRSLELLDLNSDEDAKTVRALVRSHLLQKLRVLHLGSDELTASNLAPLLAALPTGQLQRLTLAWGAFGDKGARLLADCPALTGLRELDLYKTGIGPEGVTALATSPYLRGLEWLRLGDNKLGPAGFAALAGVAPIGRKKNPPATQTDSPFPRLRFLGLAKTRPTRAGLEALLGSPLLSQLEHLDLSSNRLGAAGAALLAGSSGLSSLRFLDLATCSLGDEGVRALVSSPALANLVGLDLMQNRITDNGVQALADSPSLERLAWLRLRLNKLTDKGADALLAWRPGTWAGFDVAYSGMSLATAERVTAAGTLPW